MPDAGAPYTHQTMFPLGSDSTTYRKLTSDVVREVEFNGRRELQVDPEGITLLTREAFHDCSHLMRPSHLQSLRNIIDDPEASANDRFVAFDMLKNAVIASGKVLPICQDTGTATVIAKKGEDVRTGADDEAAIALGAMKTYTETNLRYSQVSPLTMFTEANTGNNMPAQIEIHAVPGDEYRFLFIAKGGGSSNKSFLYQENKALLTPERLTAFIDEKLRTIGTAACPPYHLAVVIGGTSPELTMKTVKMASTRYYDSLPTEGGSTGHAYRDLEWEARIHKLSQDLGIGAQFGGKYFCHDVRVIRLPRHGGSCPVGIGMSCSADRQALGKITRDGIFVEALETDPSKYLPEVTDAELGGDVVKVDLNRPMAEVLAQLSQYPVKTRLSLTGTLVVARDIAHARIKERLDAGGDMPDYLKNHPVYYAGPAKTPAGYASGSFGPTSAQRMDSYIDQFQAAGGSLVMLSKGNRAASVTRACKSHGGFYLGSIGGPAARLAKECIRKVEVLDYEDLGMEAVWRIEVEDFPAFIVIDDKGNDFFREFIPG
jgi:fumarate hydratase class I